MVSLYGEGQSMHEKEWCSRKHGVQARECLALAGRGMQASRRDTRAASQAFECMHMHAKHMERAYGVNGSKIMCTHALLSYCQVFNGGSYLR
jgi:hypothetical protein